MSSHEVWCFSALVAASFFFLDHVVCQVGTPAFLQATVHFLGPPFAGNTQAARKLEQSPFAGPILCGSSFAEPMLRGKPFGRTFFSSRCLRFCSFSSASAGCANPHHCWAWAWLWPSATHCSPPPGCFCWAWLLGGLAKAMVKGTCIWKARSHGLHVCPYIFWVGKDVLHMGKQRCGCCM